MGAKEEKDENAVEGEKNAKEASVKPKGMIEESGERRNEKRNSEAQRRSPLSARRTPGHRPGFSDSSCQGRYSRGCAARPRSPRWWNHRFSVKGESGKNPWRDFRTLRIPKSGEETRGETSKERRRNGEGTAKERRRNVLKIFVLAPLRGARSSRGRTKANPFNTEALAA